MKTIKGIILAGGTGTRLYPLTKGTNKHLLSIYDKPVIYYPLSTLISFGIRDICIISNQEFLPSYMKLFSDGKHLGINIQYRLQPRANGLPEAFLIAEDFLGDYNVLILGDNIFYDPSGKMFSPITSPSIFTFPVTDPQNYGIVELNKNGNIISLEEKPKSTNSNLAVTGLYIFDKNVATYARRLSPSNRLELEIVDLIKLYTTILVHQLNTNVLWKDIGSPQNLLEASNEIRHIQETQNVIVGCVEKACFDAGFLTKEMLSKLVFECPNGYYKNYLSNIL